MPELMKPQVRSEIGRLRRVMLHRPGAEMEHLLPRQLSDMLFEDIPWVQRMREEHDAFAAALIIAGAQVVYVEDLLAEVLADDQRAAEFADQFLREELAAGALELELLRDLFLSATAEQRAAIAISGVSPRQISQRPESLADHMLNESSRFLQPLPNLYFTRDICAVLGQGLVLCSMATTARRREAMLMRLIALNHPDFAGAPLLYDSETCHMPIEGGDILALSQRAVAVGCSQRTDLHAIDFLARRLLDTDPEYQCVLAVELPPERAFMHLDTVLTMVDRDSFIVYPRVVEQVNVVEISRGKAGGLAYRRHDHIRGALASALGLDSVRLILSGGGDAATAAREQWNDASNTLAVAPGRVVVYNRNAVSNRCLRQAGVDTIEIEGSELVRGRGGPHCMSMPLLRDLVD